MSQYQLIAFDMDGTLWDSTENITKAWNEVLIKYGYGQLKLTVEQVSKEMGKLMRDIADSLFKDIPENIRYEIFEECLSYENEYLFKNGANVYDGVEDVFKELIKIFFNYSLKQMEVLRKEVTGKNIRSEIKFKEFLINGVDNNWENHFLNSDILLLSRKDEEFQKLMIYFNQKMVSIVVEILTVINPELQEDSALLKAKMIMNLIQNSYPSFSKFDSEDEKERYIETFVNVIFSISFNE